MRKLVQGADGLEDKLGGFLYKWRAVIFLLCVTLLAFWARTYFWPFVSMDFSLFLDDWLNQIRSMQGFHSIGVQIGNYTAPYHYLLAAFTYVPGLNNLQVIKITSTVADFFLAVSLALLVLQISKSKTKAVLAYCIALCLPTVFLNSAAWGQCDAMYAAIVLFCIYFWLRQNKVASLALYGFALAVKLQAIFVLPAFVILWLCGRLRIRHLLAGVAAYFVAFVPAMLGSGSFAPLFAAYGMQTVVHTLAPNMANGLAMLNNFGQDEVYMFNSALVIFALLLLGAVAYYCWSNRAYFTKDSEFILLFLMVCFVPYCMPGMRERYFFIAEVLAVGYALYWPRRVFVPLCLQLGTLPSYVSYLAGGGHGFGSWLIVVMGVPALTAFWDLYRHLQAEKKRCGGMKAVVEAGKPYA